jgi:type II secretory pathway pseudopilin PulG
MLDIAISAALAVFALAMGFLGLWMSLHVPDTASKKRSYKIAFGVLSLLSVALVVWQGIRNAQAQSSLQSDVRDARNEASEARKEAKHVREQFGKVQNELEREGVRRQQAERDLALIVQSAGKETRAGVADDIRKTPLKIDVSEFKRPPRITSVNRWPAEPNSSPPYEVKFLVMVDQTVTPIRLMVECANVITSAEGMILRASVGYRYFVTSIDIERSAYRQCQIPAKRPRDMQLYAALAHLSDYANSSDRFHTCSVIPASIAGVTRIEL